ncbi:hypothetical protein Q3G72_018245 [Acer saccharum]|nr:hypothetical protein Q3G72_018245 [Acer saccharum]
MESHYLYLYLYLYLALSYLVLFSVLAVGGHATPLLGGWQPIQNLSKPHVQEISMGQFAVSEYNRRSKALLIFESVVEGESQVVKDGTTFNTDKIW